MDLWEVSFTDHFRGDTIQVTVDSDIIPNIVIQEGASGVIIWIVTANKTLYTLSFKHPSSLAGNISIFEAGEHATTHSNICKRTPSSVAPGPKENSLLVGCEDGTVILLSRYDTSTSSFIFLF